MVVGGTCRHSQALLKELMIAVSLQTACRFKICNGSESAGISGASVVVGVGSATSRFSSRKYEVVVAVTVVVVEGT